MQGAYTALAEVSVHLFPRLAIHPQLKLWYGGVQRKACDFSEHTFATVDEWPTSLPRKLKSCDGRLRCCLRNRRAASVVNGRSRSSAGSCAR